jgi:hypothetical protein
MQKKSRLAVGAAVIVVALLVIVFGRMYVIRDDSGGDLIWNSNEAYLFMGVARRGARIGYLEYPWILLKQLLYGVREPDDQRTSVTVVHITTSGIERHLVPMLEEQPGNSPALYKAIDGRIYANWQGYAYKWTGNEFEKATEEERARYESTKEVFEGDIEKGPDGWSQRGFGEASSDYQFAVDVGGSFTLDITNKLQDQGGHSVLAVQLVRPGGPPEDVWHLDGRPKVVSRREYRRVFEER